MNALIRTSILLACLLTCMAPVQAQLNLSGNAPAEETSIQFEKTEYNMGEFPLGDTVHGVFKFKNVGQADLLIENVKPSCQCTKLIYPEKPIKPGGTGEIFASIDTEGKTGEQSKWFMVFYNGNPPMERVTMNFTVKAGSNEEKEIEMDAPHPNPVPAQHPEHKEEAEPEASAASVAPKPAVAPAPPAPAADKPAKAKKKSKKKR